MSVTEDLNISNKEFNPSDIESSSFDINEETSESTSSITTSFKQLITKLIINHHLLKTSTGVLADHLNKQHNCNVVLNHK
ncbi:3498_t:CDS:2, partial [Dentiscutata heterogama]